MPRPSLLPLLAVALLSACASAPDAPDAGPPEAPLSLRVLTYNIHHGEGTDGRIDLPRIAKLISDATPDVVALQEVDVNTRRTGGVDQAAELGRLTGMRVAFARAIDHQGGQYGQAILARVAPGEVKTHGLPGKPESERRIAVAATLRPWGEKGPQVQFIGTHLDHVRDDADRLRQADEINRLFVRDDGNAVILTGDLNAVPQSEVMKKFAAHWDDAAQEGGGAGGASPTVPAEKPSRRIDYVLLRPKGRWRVVGVTVLDEPVASDHRPVLAVLEWRGGSARQ